MIEIGAWILLAVTFTGPTSADKITYNGTFATETACELAAPKYGQHVCVPLGDKLR